MKRWKLVFFIMLIFSFFQGAYAQNTSNKGTEFWVAYTGHVDGTNSRLYLYLTSDVNTTAAVKIGGTDIPGSPFTIKSNEVTPVLINPEILQVYIGSSDVIEKNRAIQVVAQKPVVVYSHIFRAARSAATLVLPTKVLGREYYVAAYTQNQNANAGVNTYSQFTIIAVEDQTTIQITPTALELSSSHTANTTFTKVLQKGEIYQYQSKSDLSGSHIVSVAGANGSCKPIAVFSGSSWVGFCSSTQPSNSGGDNLYQQLYPITAWGKEFITAPFINKPYDVFRIYFSKDNTTLTINGTPVKTGNLNYSPGPAKDSYQKGEFFEFVSSTPNQIKASEPISLVQYQISQSCDIRNNGTGNDPPYPGDPEMTVLNPVEQTLSKITVYSALRDQTNPRTQILQHFINVIIKDDYKESFTIDGSAPKFAFTSIAGSGYSYLQEDVTGSSSINPTHTLEAGGGFSAIAYGYGPVESYGYLAGADVKNLFQNIQISNPATQMETPDVCVGISAEFTLVLPYQTSSLTWTFDNVTKATINNPVATTTMVNGVQVYKYSYGQDLTFSQPGSHEVKVKSLNPSPAGCDPNEEITLNFEVYDLPVAIFSADKQQSCAGMPVVFSNQSLPKGKKISKWHWNFGDGTPVETRTSGDPFEHVFANPGDFQVTLSVASESGCESEVTAPLTIHVGIIPEAKFNFTSPSCETKEVAFTDVSTVAEGTIVKWNWNFGDASQSTVANPNVSNLKNPVHTFSLPGTYTVTLVVETDEGCTNIPFKIDVIVHELPKVDFTIPDVCVSDAVTFTNLSKDADGTNTNLRYVWDFGDSGSGVLNSSVSKDGAHKYSAPGNYTVTLTVFNGIGCGTKTIKTFTVNGANPIASFEVLDKDNLCSNKDFMIKNTSTVDFGKITRLDWYIDGQLAKTVDNPVPDDVYAFNYPSFTSPLSKSVIITLIAYSGSAGGSCKMTKDEEIILKASPVVAFYTPGSVCINSGTVQIVATETGNSIGEGVFTGQGIIDPSGIFDPRVAGAGAHVITYRFTSSNGCTDEKTQLIDVFPAPVADAGEDIRILIGGEKRLKGYVSGSDVRFKWTPNTGLDRDDVLDPLVKIDHDIEYTLTVTSDQGCKVTDKVFVYVLQDIKVPNAFSPNGDGINDVWKLLYLDSYPGATVEIFNRYGEIIFNSKGYSIPFDGNYRGQPLPVGTYYYLIDPKNGRKSISGALTLIR